MRILVKNNWRDGYLDYFRHEDEYRIKIEAVKSLEKLEDVYVVRTKSFRMVWNYLLKFGPVAVWRKIKSRLSEEARNEKFVSIGIGTVLTSAINGSIAAGSKVFFILPFHPKAVERAVLPEELILESRIQNLEYSENKILYLPPCQYDDKWWEKISGWSNYSGIKLHKEECEEMLKKVGEEIKKTDWKNARSFDVSEDNNVTEAKILRDGPKTNKQKGILFGLGNYAKVQIVPNIKKYIELVGVHEIDPAQIPSGINYPYIDSAPHPRSHEDYDVLFIAGYHHTHTPIAIEALRKNKHAVAEKPIVVDRKQLDELLEALQQTQGKFFAGFHKRYSPFNEMAREDLGSRSFGEAKDKPINYHCIAYEVPYPKNFWYNWPNSKGPITANGCHWIDHFLYLNNWSKPKRLELFLSSDMTTNTSIELENGAVFTMTLTEQGSPYIGVQDYVELRVGNKTAKIIDDSKYISENEHRVVRKRTINKMNNYKAMYETISRKIAHSEKGDSPLSVKVSSEAMLDLEERFNFDLTNVTT